MSLQLKLTNDVALCVPTLNAGATWKAWLEALDKQTLKPSVLVVDSSSSDATAELARSKGHKVSVIDRDKFNHGGTRQTAADILSDFGIVIFLTQDAILANTGSLEAIVHALNFPSIGAVYGRQIPHPDAGPVPSHARKFNYPETSHTFSAEDIPQKGLRAAFISNSFAAYRTTALMEVGGFPADVIFGEDMVVGARMLLSGWQLGYAADALVYHSHDYSIREEFQRYFDIGVLHHREAWLLENFGNVEGEGMKFVISEIHYLLRNAPHRIPGACIRTVAKYTGYLLGRRERLLSLHLIQALSMNKRFWQK